MIIKKPAPLEIPMGEEEDSYLAQLLENTGSPKPLGADMKAEARVQVGEALGSLPFREEAVIRSLYGIGLEHAHTLQEVARRFSMSPEMIQQIEQKALARLRLSNGKQAHRSKGLPS